MSVDDFGRVFGFDLRVERIVGHHLDDGPLFAKTETTRRDDLHRIFQPFFRQGFLETLRDERALRGLAARTATDQQRARPYAAGRYVAPDLCAVFALSARPYDCTGRFTALAQIVQRLDFVHFRLF